MDKGNKYNYTILTGDMNAKVGNTKLTGVVGANGEAALNDCKTLTDFRTWNNLKITGHFFLSITHKCSLEARGHKSIAIL